MLEEGCDPAYVQAYREYWSGSKENLRKNYPDLYRHFESPADIQAMHMSMVKERHDWQGRKLSEVLAEEKPAAYVNSETSHTPGTSLYTIAQSGTNSGSETNTDSGTNSSTGTDTNTSKLESTELHQFAKPKQQEVAEKEMIEKGIISENLSEITSRYNKNNQVLCGFIILATEYYGYLKEFDVSKKGRRRKMKITQKRNYYKKRYKMKTISQIRSRREKCIDAALEVLECMNKNELILKGKVVFK